MLDGGKRGVGLLLLKTGAIAGALVFLAGIMVNACRHRPRYAPATKAGPLLDPAPQAPPPPGPPRSSKPAAASPPKPVPPRRDRHLAAPTKAGPVFDPDEDLSVMPAPQAPQPQSGQTVQPKQSPRP